MMPLEKAFCSISEAMRSHHPLVHHITNYVTAGFCADAALAIGASPMMADEEGEMPAISQLSDALVLNLGTMNERTYGAMKKPLSEPLPVDGLSCLTLLGSCRRPSALMRPVPCFRLGPSRSSRATVPKERPSFLGRAKGKGRGFPF